MSLRQLLRKPFLSLPRPPALHLHHPQTSTPRLLNTISRRFQSSEATTRARIDRVLSRLPRFLHPYTNGLRNAPVSHIIAFLLLHEITAIVPLVGLAGLFHYTNWLPTAWSEGKYISEGVERFGRYFRRKGWFGFSQDQDQHQGQEAELGVDGKGGGNGNEIQVKGEDAVVKAEERWGVGENGGKILVEVATAYALTKVFLPARILVSVWGTPWFARVFVGRFRGLFRRGKTVVGSGSSRTGPAASGVIGKEPKLP